jgi:SNF2 family DNA or RNA helicase
MPDIDFRITSADYIYLDFDYDKELVNYVKENIPGRKYVKRSKEWKFKLNRNSLPDFLKFLQDWDLDKSDVPRSIQNRMESIIKEAKKVEKQKEKNKRLAEKDEVEDFKVYGLAQGMNPYPFQEVGIKYAVENKNVIIGDEPGLGKTVESIAAMHKQDAYPVLVVCPASLKDNWKREWNMWLPRKTAKVQHSSEGLDLRARVCIINYDILWKYRKKLREHDWGGLILDESHYVKNGSAKRSKAARQIARRIDGPKILLSGTAVVNRPKELINQLKIIDRFEEEFGGFYPFVKRYCDAEQTRWGLDYDGASNVKELHERLKKLCYIRRNKKEVLEDLPDKQRSYIEFDIDNRKEYDVAEEDLAAHLRKQEITDEDFLEKIESLDALEQQEKIRKEYGANEISGYAEKLMKLAELRKLASKGKLKKAKRWIKDFLKSGEKLVLFAHHKFVIQEIVDEFDALKIDGSVPVEDRQDVVDKFQNDDSEKVIVLNIQAGGTGLTLTESSNVVFLELPWTPAEVSQAEDRCHRIGQEDSVNVYFLLAKETIDKDMFEVLKKKRIVTEQINAGKDITDEEGNVVKGVIKKITDRQS